MNEFILIFGLMIIVFIVGIGTMLFLGGRTTINYLKVKWSRGKRLLIFIDTPLGRKTTTGKIEGEINEGVVSWKYHGDVKLTELTSDFVGDFFKVKYIALNVETPERPYDKTILGEMPARSIDVPTFNNILKRMATRPTLDDDTNKKLKILMILTAVVGLAVLFTLFKVISVEQAIATLGVI